MPGSSTSCFRSSRPTRGSPRRSCTGSSRGWRPSRSSTRSSSGTSTSRRPRSRAVRGRHGSRRRFPLPPEQLSPLDAAFLRLEDESAHMHIALIGYFEPPAGRVGPTIEALQASVEARLANLPRFRQRLAWPPGGLDDPFWVDDPGFDVGRHVVAGSSPEEAMPRECFDELVDELLSTPLERS